MGGKVYLMKRHQSIGRGIPNNSTMNFYQTCTLRKINNGQIIKIFSNSCKKGEDI